jgi:hypothetical protein
MLKKIVKPLKFVDKNYANIKSNNGFKQTSIKKA